MVLDFSKMKMDRRLRERLNNIGTIMKGGEKNMDIKSRYEVIAELEEKKRKLIMERDNLSERLREKKKELRDSEREVEDLKEDVKTFEESLEDRKSTINELIQSTEDSLKRLSELNKTSK